MATALKSRRAALLVTAGICAASITGTPALARIEASGGAQLSQVLAYSRFNDGDTAGWLEADVFGRADIDLRRVQGSVSANVSRRFEEFGNLSRSYSIRGLADATGELVEDTFYLRAGGNAQDVQRDTRFGLGGVSDPISNNSIQLFSLYAEPTLQQNFGGDVSASASYRIGALFSDNTFGSGQIPIGGGGGIGGGIGGGGGGFNQLGGLGDSVTQAANARIQFGGQDDKLRTALLGNWTRDDVDRLDQEYRSYSAGASVTYQLNRKLSLNTEGGYENIENTQSSILFDTASGLPVLDEDGDFVADPAQPRITAFERDGPYGTVGFRYAPNRRTSLQAFGGYRFGGANFGGTLSYQPTPRINVSGSVQRGLTSLARQLTQNQIGGVTVTPIDPLQGADFSDLCPLGYDPILGLCLSGLSGQPVTSATYRNTSARLGASYSRERWSVSATLAYNDRKYLNSLQLQDEESPSLSGLNISTESYSAGVRGGYELSSGESLSGGLTYTHSSQFLGGGANDQVTATAGYRRSLARSLYATANATAAFRLGNTAFNGSGGSYLASVGVGYQF